MIPNDQEEDTGVQREIRAKLVGMKLNPLQTGRSDLSSLVENMWLELAGRRGGSMGNKIK